MTQDVRDAVRILAIRAAELKEYQPDGKMNADAGIAHLLHAIRHLAYPDRDVYPKTRRGTKGAPIVRK